MSSIVYYVFSPMVSRCSCMSLNTRVKLQHDIDFMGRIRILLRFYSYKTNIYLFTMFEVTGNLPVRSVAIFLFWSMILVATMLLHCYSGVVGGSSFLVGS